VWKLREQERQIRVRLRALRESIDCLAAFSRSTKKRPFVLAAHLVADSLAQDPIAKYPSALKDARLLFDLFPADSRRCRQKGCAVPSREEAERDDKAAHFVFERLEQSYMREPASKVQRRMKMARLTKMRYGATGYSRVGSPPFLCTATAAAAVTAAAVCVLPAPGC
jgi:hypothetical protein